MRTRIKLTAAIAASLASASAFAEQRSPLAADEVRAIVTEALADAEGRSSLLQASAGAGHDGKFFVASTDGGFRLNVGGQVQFRYLLNRRDDEGGTVDDFDTGFTLSRTALRFDGHMFEQELFYGVQAVFNSAGGAFTLEEAFVGHQFDNGLIFIIGQYREPILWEDVISETHALAVDQSTVNAAFGQGRSQGAWIHYSTDEWRMWAGVNDGVRSANTDTATDTADWGLTTRWERKLAGEWGQFDQFSSTRGSAYAAKIGGGVHFERSPDTPATAITDTFAWTGDLMFEGDGWNAFLMGVGFHTNTNGGASNDDYGFMAQGGFFVSENTEPFARYDVIVPDSDRAASSVFNTLTFGVNHYLHGQAAKLTLDAVWYLDSTSGNAQAASVAGTSTGNRIGLLSSADEDQFAVRLQFQLLF